MPISTTPSGSGSTAEWAKCRFAVVTALPKEFAAMVSMLDRPRGLTLHGDPNDYSVGYIPALDGSGTHVVVVALQKKPANNSASAVASHLSHSFPNLDDVLMVGIAGGVPHPEEPSRHVRLGDIVVSDQSGVMQYDHLKLEAAHVELRSTTTPPSASLLGKVRLLEAGRFAGAYPWEQHMARAVMEGAERPDTATDRLFSSDNPSVELIHPHDPSRRSDAPRIHYGPIGSSNVLLKDPNVRDALRDRYGVRAVEMEGSGIADGTWTARLGYIVIRGVCDYCDQHKNDTWQAYAAVVAAAYARALLESFAVVVDPITRAQIKEAERKLEQALAAIDINHYDAAAALAEEAADLAHTAGDQKLERRAVLQAIRAWGEHLSCGALPEGKAKALQMRSGSLVARLDRLGERPSVVALERAQLARFDHEPAVVLRWAAEAAKDEDPVIKAEAMLIRLQAYWQSGDIGTAVASAAEVGELRRSVPEDVRFVLDATWLRTLCKAGQHQPSELRALANAASEQEPQGYRRTSLILGEVAAEFNRAGRLEEARLLCEAAYALVVRHGNSRMLVNIALQAAELSAELNDREKARLYLGYAESWASRREEGDDFGTDSDETVRAMVLFTKGRVLARLADKLLCESESTYEEAFAALNEARRTAIESRSRIQGDIELFLADLSWWLGRIALNLGRVRQARTLLAAVRSDAAMAQAGFRDEIVSKAWLLEAEAAALSGDLAGAAELASALLDEPRISEESKGHAREFRRFLSNRVRPMVEWFVSPEAMAIKADVLARGLKSALADQLSPLLEWWRDWSCGDGHGPESELLDFWGRGGFARVAAAVSVRPHRVIAVDARSVIEIRNWARIFCPLFDCVIVKWKGELGAGLTLTPQHVAYEGWGGHGYATTASMCDEKPYAVAVAWANPLPYVVSHFLADEASALVRSGRLIVLPAPLVGCVQSAVGWTDNLLVEGLLGGVINVVSRLSSRIAIEEPGGGAAGRFLDVARVRLPFIDGVPISDLASVLDETERWAGSLRKRIMDLLGNGDLSNERWTSITTVEDEIEESCRELTEGINEVARGRDWRVSHLDGSMSVGSRGADQRPAREPVAGFLQSITSTRRDLSPWIPYWRLSERGGVLNWTCPIDNPSTVADRAARAQMAALGTGQTADVQAWLYPGTGGWTFPTAVRM